MFGDVIVETFADDIGIYMSDNEIDDEDYHAVLEFMEGEGFWFEIRRNDDGETVISSDPGLFASEDEMRRYLAGNISDVLTNVV
jgi:hypothetical protein